MSMALAPKDLALVVLFTFIWGFNFVVVKIGLDSFPPLLFSALRFLFAAIPAIFFVSRAGISIRLILGVGLVLGILHYSALYIGISLGMPPGLASLMVQTHIMLTLLLSYLFLDEKPSSIQFTGIVISFLGLSFFISLQFTPSNLLALGAVLAAAGFLACSNVMVRAARVRNTVSLTVWASAVPPVPLLLLSLLLEQGHVDALVNLSWGGIGALAYAGLLATLLATAILANLLGKYSANVVAPFFLLVPIFGNISSAFVLGERPTVEEYVSSAIVLLGLLIILRDGSAGVPAKGAAR